MCETEDKKGPTDEEFLLSQLDTENVEHENTAEVGNLFSNKPEVLNEIQRSNISRYNLRRSPRPSVRLNSLKLDNQIILKSILKPGYTYYYPTIDDLLLLDTCQVRATKKAIRLHKSENAESFAIRNPNLEEILFFRFKNGISTLLANFDRWLPHNSHNKKVTFQLNEGHRSHVKLKSAILSFGNIETASYFCTSMKELHLHQDHIEY